MMQKYDKKIRERKKTAINEEKEEKKGRIIIKKEKRKQEKGNRKVAKGKKDRSCDETRKNRDKLRSI